MASRSGTLDRWDFISLLSSFSPPSSLHPPYPSSHDSFSFSLFNLYPSFPIIIFLPLQTVFFPSPLNLFLSISLSTNSFILPLYMTHYFPPHTISFLPFPLSFSPFSDDFFFSLHSIPLSLFTNSFPLLSLLLPFH